MSGQHTASRTSAVRRTLAAALTAGFAAVPLAALPAAANTAGTGVVINEAYLSGGSAGAAFKNKFVELYNPTDAAVSLDGWSLQYRSASGTGNPTGVVPLKGSIAAKGYYLVQANSNGASGADLPAPDLLSTLTPSGTTGTLVLASQAAAVAGLGTGDVRERANVVDLLGYGSSNTFEGRAAAAPSGNTDVKSFNRTGAADTDDNRADFSLSAAITPTGSGTQPGPGPDPQPALRTIAEIQGSGAASPLAGQTVTTRGVVTAAYPSGGFNGYYLQTPGTGGDTDAAARTASDAVFVFSRDTVGQVRPGDYVEVTGTVSEFGGLTELTVPAGKLTQLSAPAEAVKPAAIGWPATEAEREKFEGMLLRPAGSFTVTDNYGLNQYGEIALAAGDGPLLQPTSVGAYGSDAFWHQTEENAARAVTLDDGASTDFLRGGKDIPLPYLAADAPVRIGAAAEFSTDVVLDYRFNQWRFQPLAQLTAENAAAVQPARFEDTRTPAPAEVGGNIRIATFNVLNYFTTTGDQLPGCTYYEDRAGNPVTVRGGCDARGAADAANLQRQQDKLVAAINGLGADVVSLEEIENSAKFGRDRDAALATLAQALNAALAAAGKPGTWDYVRSPEDRPALENEDVIRTAFIYNRTAVQTIDDSVILADEVNFDNAREPLAQTFKVKHGSAKTKFIVVANHFKSKGSAPASGENADHGQGGWNADRVGQAKALVAFAETMKKRSGTDKVFLAGDFNSYEQEDPIRVLEQAGYVSQGAKTGKYSYSFDGMSGSLDHVFASAEADARVAGADIWNINSVEPVALEYSRYNYNATNFYAPDMYRASDHDPLVVGLDLPTARDQAHAKKK
ncbi:ExeM/NucH family extracellular endonuclease [Arthrobacter sp. I2-34]|uniref:ExeM/NucH family extracellular endonuclease n=1 Tax=Arthrobacter hankyongi TaxID=2904801 RepID=A0ABS9L8F5_9MICC|nr:ExeM/NucH family extracellular endonuclease [Arthrobacter hankyongi]MCG2622911.1 ExeM/NucH family extracellular endonuclease [Arthrobacter hankyongi]